METNFISERMRIEEEAVGKEVRVAWWKGKSDKETTEEKSLKLKQKGNFKIAEMWDTGCKMPESPTC